jgi:2-hydroxychromene-2-carboxylate isomerase
VTELAFHFDYLSPYAYIGWHLIHPLAERMGVTVRAVPVLFAGLLDHHGTKGPAEIPAKRIYVFKDTVRTADLHGLALSPPPTHPFNPLLALRVSSLPMEERERKALVTALFDATWGGGPGVTDPAVVADLASRVGLDGPALVARAGTDEAKKLVRDQTERAISAGVFGVPTVVANGEPFWGVDSFPHLERFLRGDDPFARLGVDKLIAWSGTAPSATRARGTK